MCRTDRLALQPRRNVRWGCRITCRPGTASRAAVNACGELVAVVGCAVVEVGAEGDVADVETGTGAGAGRKVAPSAARVPATSTRPAPTPCIAWALEVIAWVTAAADEVGENDIARAARPDTTGVLAEVPHTSA